MVSQSIVIFSFTLIERNKKLPEIEKRGKRLCSSVYQNTFPEIVTLSDRNPNITIVRAIDNNE